MSQNCSWSQKFCDSSHVHLQLSLEGRKVSLLFIYLPCLCYRGIDFGELLSPEVRAKHPSTVYDLVANIIHDGEPGPGHGTYRIHILHRVSLVLIQVFDPA